MRKGTKIIVAAGVTTLALAGYGAYTLVKKGYRLPFGESDSDKLQDAYDEYLASIDFEEDDAFGDIAWPSEDEEDVFAKNVTQAKEDEEALVEKLNEEVAETEKDTETIEKVAEALK